DVHFTYKIDDGRGKDATASVTVHVYPAGVNTAPRLLPTAPRPVIRAVGGQTISLDVLDDWRDREGDALFIASTHVVQGIAGVTGGTITFTAPPGPGRHPLTYVVSDGTAKTAHTIVFDVLKPDDHAVAADAEPDVVSTRVGKAVTFAPLANDIP